MGDSFPVEDEYHFIFHSENGVVKTVASIYISSPMLCAGT